MPISDLRIGRIKETIALPPPVRLYPGVALESGMGKKLPRAEYHWLKPPGPVADGLKIGLLGGSFNPAHEGHLHVSEMALKQLGLDYVWWLVAPQNPLKPRCGMAPLQQRLAYAADKFEQHPRILVVDLERTIGTRYTIDTLRVLKRRFPRVHFVWLMGSDNLESFRRWRQWPDIVRAVPIAIVMRPGTSTAPLHSKATQRFAYARATDLRTLPFAHPPAIAILDGGRRCPQSASAIRAQNLRAEALVRMAPAC